ncbi:MAG: hypothetical protein PVH50_07260 [Anaerolineae bacterium]|jgi:hypothetical protein
MSLNTFFLIRAIVALVFGVSLTLAPSFMMSFYGLTAGPVGLLLTRELGGVLIGIGLLCLSVRAVTDHQALKSITLGFFAIDAIGFIIALAGQFGPAASAMSWMNVVIWLLLALGFAYFRFIKL